MLKPPRFTNHVPRDGNISFALKPNIIANVQI